MKRFLPPIFTSHKICIICEGDEEYDYLNRLKELNVWSKSYSIKLRNASSIDNISAIYQYEYAKDNYDLILIFCDTEMYPYTQINKLKNSLLQLFGNKDSVKSVLFYANPCTMQIILSHFKDIRLTTNDKSKNQPLIQKLTTVKNYRATERQRKAIMNKINSDNYEVLKSNLAKLETDELTVGSTNFLALLKKLENDDTKWISEINGQFEKGG